MKLSDLFQTWLGRVDASGSGHQDTGRTVGQFAASLWTHQLFKASLYRSPEWVPRIRSGLDQVA